MTDKSSFTPDEWKQILGSVMLTGLAVSASAHSGLWGTLKESFASGRALIDARDDPNENSLVRAVVNDFETSDGRSAARDAVKGMLAGAANSSDVETKAVAALGQVSNILDAKAPGDAPAFKAWLQSIGERTAEASTEGSFFGFGSGTVSDAEKTALAEIAKALNTPSTPSTPSAA